MSNNYDFCGWATKNDLRCSDGRIIRRDAFKHNDGEIVPLVWNHMHMDPGNVLGHALLENRAEGVFTYCSFNETEKGKEAKELVKHGDIVSLSIYANKLKQNGSDVIHGSIREVSLVLAGANPGAYIETILEHSEDIDGEAIIYSAQDLSLEHADNNEPEEKIEEEKDDKKMANEDKTVKDVFDTLNEEQKTVVYALIGEAIQNAKNEDNDDEDEGEEMKHNVFMGNDNYEEENFLSHSEMKEIFDDMKRYGSLKDSVLQHGIENIDYLFPDAQAVNKTPEWIKREDAWVGRVLNGVHHTPFSRIKSMAANITEDDARALGYIKGNLKKEEVFTLLKRTTTPTTIYKKQKLDRDDLVDVVDFDTVAWLKAEMRMMLDEEIARAVLVGDGRLSSSDDKISETNIRPIWTDHELYTIRKSITVTNSDTDDQKAKKFLKAAVKSRKEYKGSGNPIMFATEDIITDLLLMEDTTGRIIYDSMDKLKTALRVSDIVTVPILENQTRTESSTTYTLAAIYLNLNDYNIGADKGGAVNMFDDFDIDYNAQKYLIETRCSGALVKPYSAVALEFVTAS